MKKKDIVDLLVILNSYYGKKFEYPKPEDTLTDVMESTWYRFLKEYPYDVVKVATERLMVKKEWAPTPGEIITEIDKMKEGEEGTLTAEEAWYEVKEAISKIGYTYNPQEVKDALPEKALRAAQVVGLGLIAKEGDNNTYLMNSFIKAYENLEEVRQERRLLPKGIREETKKLGNKFKGTPHIEAELNDKEAEND